MAYATYAQPAYVHPDRLGARRTTAILWLVVHTSEGGESTSSAEGLAGYIGSKGDRKSGSGFYGSSYHAIADTDRVIPVVPDDYVAKAAAGGNANGLHICFPGTAYQTEAQWLDTNSSAMLEQGARWIVDKMGEHSIPLARLDPLDLTLARRGICGHNEVSEAFKQSSHWDPGDGFPWKQFLGRVKELAAPSPTPKPVPVPAPPGAPLQEDPMFIVRNKANVGEFWITDLAGTVRRITDNDAVLLAIERYARAGRPLINVADGAEIVPGTDYIVPADAKQIRLALGDAA